MTDAENTKRELMGDAQKTDRGGLEIPNVEHMDLLSSLKIKLYYVFSSKRQDLWEDLQRRAVNSTDDETLLRWVRKPLKDITPDEQHDIAIEAFHAALQGKDQTMMVDIVRTDQLDLQTRDLAEIVDKDYLAVLKAIIQKPLPVSRKLKRDFQCPKYHRAERILNIIGVETKEEYLQLGDIVDYIMDNGMPDCKLEKLLTYFAGSHDKTALRSLLIHEKEKMAEHFYREGKIESTDVIMLVALEYKCYSFLLLYMKVNNCELSDEAVATQLFAKLVKQLPEDLPHAELYLYIMRKYINYIPYSSAKEFVEMVNEWMKSPNLRVPFVFAAANPIKICVLIIELLTKIKKDNDILEKWIENIMDDMLKLGTLLINEVHDDNELNEIFMDVDLDGRSVILIAATFDMLPLFKHKSISSVTSRFWSGPYNAKEHPFSGNSMLLANLTHNPTSRLDMFFRSLPKLFSRDYLHYPTHNFQYVTWRDGTQSRYLLESLFYVFLFAYTYYLIASVTYYGRAAYSIIRECNDNQESLTLQEINDVGSNFSSMVDYLKTIQTFFLLIFIAGFRHIFTVCFAFITDRTMQCMYAEMMLDAALNVCFILYYGYVYNDFEDVLGYHSNVLIFNTKVKEFWDGNNWVVPLFAIILALIFLRSLNLLEVNDVVGPFIEMIKRMFLRLGTFSLLFVILLFFFAMVASIYLPYSIVEHRALYRSIVTLFQTSIGVFDINTMNSEMKAEIFTFIYVIVFNILLLNLLIAILTQVYTTIDEEADTLYVNNIVDLYALYAPHEEYGSLICAYPPFNFLFGLICLPILLLTPRSKHESINAVFLKIEYTLAFIIVLAVYIGAEMFFLVLCYFKVTVHLFILIFIGREWATTGRIGHFSLFLFLGPLLLLPVLLSDVYYFTLHSYQAKGERIFTDSMREPMHKRVAIKLSKFISDVKKKYAAVSWDNLRKALYDLCSIDIFSPRLGEDTSRSYIMGGASPTPTPSASPNLCLDPSPRDGAGLAHRKSKYKNYKNFSIASQILKLNSTIEDDDIMVDVDTLSNILENYLFIARLQKRQSELLKKEISEIMRKSTGEYVPAAELPVPAPANNVSGSIQPGDRSGAALISIRENQEQEADEPHILMKLCMSYSLDRYTNALISFKTGLSAHWLAKNSLLMGQDIKAAKKKLIEAAGKDPTKQCTGAIVWEEKKSDKRKRGSDPGSRDDSLIANANNMTKGPDGKPSNMSFTMQELDDILKGVEADSENQLNDSRKDSFLIIPSGGAKSPSKSLFAGETPEAKFS